jgi:hypothetical protein
LARHDAIRYFPDESLALKMSGYQWIQLGKPYHLLIKMITRRLFREVEDEKGIAKLNPCVILEASLRRKNHGTTSRTET